MDYLQVIILCVYFLSFMTVIFTNALFLVALRNISLRKTIINDIMKATCILNFLIIFGLIFLWIYRYIFEMNMIFCHIFPICGLLIIYISLFCHSLGLLTRFALLTFTKRIQRWSDKKLILTSIFINFLLLLPYLFSLKYYKSYKIFKICAGVLNKNFVVEENMDPLILFYTPQLILLFLSVYLARIEVMLKNRVDVHIGFKQQNIVTAKVQVLNGICLILVNALSAAVRHLVCRKIEKKNQMQCLAFVGYIPQYFGCFLPPLTWIIFSRTIRLYYKNCLKSLFGNGNGV